MSINRIAVAELILYLYENSACHLDIETKVGMDAVTASKWLKVFHRRKLVRIDDWKRFGNCRRYTPVWTWNHDMLPDAPYPKPKTRAQCAKEYRNRKILKEMSAALVTPIREPDTVVSTTSKEPEK